MIQYYMGAIAVIVCVLGIVTNFMTLFMILTRKMFANQHNVHIFMGNLAAVDLLACIFSAAMVVRAIVDPTIGSVDIVCGITIAGHIFIRPLELLSLALLAINRFYAIAKRGTSKVFNR